MINLVDLDIESKIKPIWRLAFRPFFLGGTIFSILAMSVWILTLSGKITFNPYGGAFFWHMHEMLFGFVSAIIVGFLLTAVQTWTGQRSLNSIPLILLFILWIMPRLLLAFAPTINPWLLAATDLSFYLIAATFFARLVLISKNYRNLFIVLILLLLAAANGLTHYSVIASNTSYANWGMQSAILLITMIMTVIGGRVIPMFTANGTKTPKALPNSLLEKIVLGSLWIITLLTITNLNRFLSTELLAVIYCVAGTSSAIRAFLWRPWVAVKTPIVWSLHSAYWFIPIGLLFHALHFSGLEVSTSTANHLLTAGAMGSLILAMITRVSLGHTGRELILNPAIKFAYIAISLAAVTRVTIGMLTPTFLIEGYAIAALLWILAYSIFVACYWGILTS